MKISRRSLLKTLGCTSAAYLLPSTQFAAAQTPTSGGLLVVFMRGGYSGVFSSADSHMGQFGVTQDNIADVGNGVFMDSAFFNALAGQDAELRPLIQNHTASVGCRHGITGHSGAQEALFSVNGQNPILSIAAAMGGSGSIKAANAGSNFINGNRSGSGISLQGINDLQATEEALFGDNGGPDRGIMARGMAASLKMSTRLLHSNPQTLASLKAAYETGITTLVKPVEPVNLQQISQDYQLRGSRVDSFASKMAAAEFLLRTGTNVVTAVDNGWDNHNDRNHNNARRKMDQEITPALGRFIQRNLQRNITVVIMGDFARTTPNSGHAPALSATVIGPQVKNGTTGRLTERADLDRNSPAIDGLWAYIAAIVGARQATSQMGGNKHQIISQI